MKAFKAFRRTWLIMSLAGMGISSVMFFIPPQLYVHSQDHDEPAITQAMWLLLFIMAFLGLIVSAIMYTYRTEDEPGPLIIRR